MELYITTLSSHASNNEAVFQRVAAAARALFGAADTESGLPTADAFVVALIRDLEQTQ